MAENTNITWDDRPIEEFDRDSLRLQRINENGTVQQMIEIINSNFENIAKHGGGPAGIDGIDGDNGIDGLNSEYIFARCDVITSADRGIKYPSSIQEYDDLFYRVNNSSSNYGNYKNVKWWNHPQGVSSENPNEYMIARYRRDEDSEWYYSDVPTLWSHWGEKGRDGDGVEYVFMVSKTELSPADLAGSLMKKEEMDPYQLAIFNIDDFFPGSKWFVTANVQKASNAIDNAGLTLSSEEFASRWRNNFDLCVNDYVWTDDPTGTSVENPFEYVAVRRCVTDEATGKKSWGNYSVPALWSNYSFEGRVFIIYCNVKLGETPVAPRDGQGHWNVTANTLDLTGLPAGWTDNNTDKYDDEATWMCSGIFDHSGNNVSWSNPVCISGKDGKAGEDGTTIQFIYALSENPDYPLTRAKQEELFDAVENATTNPKYSIYENTKWYDRAQPISPEYRTEYLWSRRRENEEDPWEYDPMPILWAHWGEDGTDGDGVEYIYITTDRYIDENDIPSNPRLALPKYEYLSMEQKKLFQIDDFVPSKYWFEKRRDGIYYNKEKAETALGRPISDVEWLGYFGFGTYPVWTDNPVNISPYVPYQWVSIRKSTSDELDGEKFWEDFSTPTLWSSFGKGTRTFVVYCNINGNDTPKRPEGGYWYNLDGESRLVNSSDDYSDYKYNALENGTPDYSSYVGYWNDKNIDVDGTISWMSSGVFADDGENISWSEPFRLTGPAGINGVDGSNETYVYALSDVEPVCPINGTYQEKLDFFTNVENADSEEWSENPNGFPYTDPVSQNTTVWYDNPQGIENEDGKRTEWVWAKTLPANATQESLWNFAPRPIIWAHWGEDGTDGDGIEYIFYKSTEKNQNDTLPANMKPVKKEDLTDDIQRTIFNIDDFYPGPGWFTESPVNNKQKAIDALTAAGLYDSETFNAAWNNKFGIPIVGGATGPYWTDNPYSPDKAYPFVWVSIRKSHPNSNGEREWGNFGEPSIWANYTMKTRIFMVYCCVDEGNPPAKPTGGWWDGSDDGGLRTREPGHELSEPWTDNDNSVTGKISYLSSGLFAENGNNIYWSAPFRMTGEKGRPGADGSNIEFVYALSDEEPQFPAYDGSTTESYDRTMAFFEAVENALEDSDPDHDGYVYTANNKSTEWFDHPQGIANVDGKRKEWVWSRSLPANSEVWTFPEKPVIWAHWGEDGTDGDGVEYIFSLGQNPTYYLTEADWNNIWSSFNTDTAKAVYSMDDFVPNENWFTNENYSAVSSVMTENGKTISSQDWESLKSEIVTTFDNLFKWTDNPSSVSAENQYQFVSIRKFSNGAWGQFSYPQLWANYSFVQFDAFAFVAVPPGVELGNYQPTGGRFANPVPDDDSTTFSGITLNWTDGPEPTSKFDEIWMTTGRVSERTPDTILWNKPKKMADSNDFQVEWSQDLLSITELNSKNSALANPIQGGYTYNNKTYETFDFGEYLTKNDNDEDAAEAAWRNAVHDKLGIEFSDNSSQSAMMATCQLKNGQWTHWVINRVKGETGEAGRSLNVTGRITYERYLDNNTYSKSIAQENLNNNQPSNPSPGERLIVYPNEPTGDIYIGDTTPGLGGALYMWKYDGSSWVDINDPATNGELPNNTYTSPNGHLILWDGDTWQDVGNIVGPAGPMNKIIIAFANDDPNDPTKKIRVEGDNIPLAKWIGFLTYNENEENSQPLNNINAPEWVWSHFKGQDGYGYEFIYKSSSNNMAPSVPYDASWVNQSNVVPESLGWVDDPIEPDSSSNRYVWMCWRKYDYTTKTWTHFAGKNGMTGNQSGAVARLWQVYANSINDVQEFFHADQNISPVFPTTGTVPAGGSLPNDFTNFWYPKSEVVGSSATGSKKWSSTNRHLFNIEVVTYTDGSMEILEPHYISSYADGIKDIVDYYILDTDGGSAPNMEGNSPIISGSGTEGVDYWTTNVKKTTISANKPYLWNISKKIYENRDEWTDPMVIGVWGAGDGAVYLDMDNEMDVIQIDKNRKVLETNTFQSIIHMYEGSNIIKMKKLEINNEDGFSGFKIFKKDSESDTTWTRVNSPSEVTFSQGVESLLMELSLPKDFVLPNEYTKIQFTITSQNDDIRLISYTLVGTTNPSIYTLKLSSNVIIKKSDTLFEPNPLYISVMKITGDKVDEYEGDQSGEGGFQLLLNNDTQFPSYNVTNQYLIDNSYNIGSKLVFKLNVDTDGDGVVDTIMDTETVYVIGEGQGYNDAWLRELLGGTTDISGALIMTGDLLARNHAGQITAGVLGHDYNNNESSNVRFFAGNTRISQLDDSNASSFTDAVENSPFRVTEGGKLFATDAIISGSIYATSLTIGSFDLTDPDDASDFINQYVSTASGAEEYDDRWLTNAFSKTTISGGLVTTGNVVTQNSSGQIVAGIMGASTSDSSSIRFFAGTSSDVTSLATNVNSAPFRVTQGGRLYATDAIISGTITATSGTIGGITIASNQIKSSNNNFSLTSAGKLTATGAVITGEITASKLSITDSAFFENLIVRKLDTLPDVTDRSKISIDGDEMILTNSSGITTCVIKNSSVGAYSDVLFKSSNSSGYNVYDHYSASPTSVDERPIELSVVNSTQTQNTSDTMSETYYGYCDPNGYIGVTSCTIKCKKYYPDNDHKPTVNPTTNPPYVYELLCDGNIMAYWKFGSSFSISETTENSQTYQPSSGNNSTIVSSTVQYQTINTNNIDDLPESGWESTITAPTATNKYLWARNVTCYEDNVRYVYCKPVLLYTYNPTYSGATPSVNPYYKHYDSRTQIDAPTSTSDWYASATNTSAQISSSYKYQFCTYAVSGPTGTIYTEPILTGDYDFSYNSTYYIWKRGVYTLRIRLNNWSYYASGSGNSSYPYVVYILYHITLNHMYYKSVNNYTLIGNDGLIQVFSDSNSSSLLFSNNSLFMVRKGNYAFRITSSGIEKSTNVNSNSPTWTSL